VTDFLERVRGWWSDAKSAPTERKIADMLAGGGITNDRFPTRVAGDKFIAGTTYFGVRLSGIHMVDARQFATTRLPLCVCLAEFETGGQRRSVPFSVGPDIIRRKLKDAGITETTGKSAWIELRDLTIVRPTPTNDVNLSLYAGLFSIPGDDLVKTLLNVVGTIGTALGNPALGPALKVADTVYDSFGALLGFNQVQQVAAALIGNALTERGSGYLLVANAKPETFLVSKGRVIDGRLHWPADREGGNAVVEFDYALLALEYFDTVSEKGTGLAEALFGQYWASVRKASKREFADEALEKLCDAISASPDLTEDDRLSLLTAYAGAAEKLIAARWPNKLAARGRGGAGDGFQSRLNGAADRLEQSGAAGDYATAEQVRIASDALDGLPDPHSPDSSDIEKTRANDEDAILGLARKIGAQLPKSSHSGDARRAAAAVAYAVRFPASG
jgi:hypothetical protein